MAQQHRKRTLYKRLGAWILTSALAAGMLPVVSMPASAAMGEYEKNEGIMWLQEDSFLISEDTTISDGLTPVDKTTFIEPNTIKMGGSVAGDWESDKKASRADTVTITSKHAIDWSQSFELQIHFENDGLPDGMAISFHNDPNYNGSKCKNGDLGVYSSRDNKGVTNAAIFEVDTFNNNDYTGYGQGAGSDADFQGKGNDACHLGFALTDEDGKVIKTEVGNKDSQLARKAESIVTIKWDAVQKRATLSFKATDDASVNETLTIENFDPGTLWAGNPVYMTISASIHQDNENSGWGRYSLRVDSFVYTGLAPEESAKYLVYRGGDMDSEPVEYNSGDKKTWPMPGDKVLAKHTMWNNTGGVDEFISIPIRVPEARISDSSNGYRVVKELTPTDLEGTTGNTTNIFNGAMSGSALSTATFTFPPTNASEGEENKTVQYTYIIPKEFKVKENYVIEDKVTIGSPIMTQYTFYNTINLGGLPTAQASDLQLQKGYNDGSFDLTTGLTYANYDGDQNNSIVSITNAEGQEVHTLDTSYVGTYKITYTVTDSRFHDAVTSFVRTITVTDGDDGGSTGGDIITKYTLTYESNGGTPFANEEYAFGTEVKLTKVPHRDGYVFTGWYSDAKLSQPVTSVTMRKNMIVYAGWEKIETTEYTLTYESNGGTPFTAEKYASGTDVKLTKIPHRDGYIFTGWYSDVKLSHPVTSVTMQKDMTVYAGWEKIGTSDLLNTRDHMAYLSGYDTGLFGPDNNMTRAEAAQMFYGLLLNKDVPITVSFADVSEDAWYAQAVNALASLGIVTGVGDGKFDPQRAITRAEFTVIAMNFTKGSMSGENIFSDVTVDDWFYDKVVGSVQYGWITGYVDGTFRPNNTITRAEVTTITNRMLGRSADQSFVDRHGEELKSFLDVAEPHWAYYQIMEATNSHDYTKANGNEIWKSFN